MHYTQIDRYGSRMHTITVHVDIYILFDILQNTGRNTIQCEDQEHDILIKNKQRAF